MTSATQSLVIDLEARRALFTDARSAVRFSPVPVSPDAVRAAYDLAKWAPTGNNAMPLRLAILSSDAARSTVIGQASIGNQAALAEAPMVIVVAADHDYHEMVHVTAPGIVGLRDKLAARPDARRTNAHDNTWLQVGYLIVALRAASLAVRPIGGFDKQGVTDALFGGTGWSSELLLMVGYPAEDGDHRAGERRPRLEWDDVARVL